MKISRKTFKKFFHTCKYWNFKFSWPNNWI